MVVFGGEQTLRFSWFARGSVWRRPSSWCRDKKKTFLFHSFFKFRVNVAAQSKEFIYFS